MTLLRRIRGAIGTGLTWALAWALGGILIGIASNVLPFLPWDALFKVFDAPLPALAVPGFVGGVLFSIVVSLAARRRRFSDLSLPGFALLGAVGGLLLSLVPAVMVLLGLATMAEGALGLWQLTAIIAVPLMLMSAASATGSLLLARAGESRELLADADELAILEADGEGGKLEAGS
jgi:hypothetical protein